MVGKWKNECDKRDVQWQEKNEVIVESSLRLLLEVVRVFEVLEFTVICMQRVQLKNYKK
jgi:hypothetical protein